VAAVVRHFRYLQRKEARQTAQKAVQKGRKEKERGGEGAGRRIRQRPTRLARPHIDARIGVRPSLREIRLEEGTKQSSEPIRKWDPERGPCETDDVTWAEFRRLGGPAGQGEGRER
jgi:hypothetical protein